MAKNNKPQKIGSLAEKHVGLLLRGRGFKTVRAPYLSPFDLVVDGARIEVKCANPSSQNSWKVNIHRHGVLKEERVDGYVIRLYKVPLTKKPLNLVFRAPLGVLTMNFSYKSLIAEYSSAIDNWALLHKICKEAQQNLPTESEKP